MEELKKAALQVLRALSNSPAYDFSRDDFSAIRLGDLVQSTICHFDDVCGCVARPGSVGLIKQTYPDYPPMVLWEESEIATHAIPGAEFEVLCAAGEFRDEATTPKQARRTFIRRGKQ